MRAHLPSLPIQVEHTLHSAKEAVQRAVGGAGASVRAALQRVAERVRGRVDASAKGVVRAVRRAFTASGAPVVLEGVERVLLSPFHRERIYATTTFALIFLFAVTSVDFLISGGPEFGAPARAVTEPRVVYAASDEAPAIAAPVAITSARAEESDANVVAVSQSFAAPPIEPAAPGPAASFAPAAPDLVEIGFVVRPRDAHVRGAGSAAFDRTGVSDTASESAPQKRPPRKGDRALTREEGASPTGA